MFTTPLVIATLVAATLGAAIGFLISHRATRPIIARLRAELADAVWQLTHDPLTGLHNRKGLRTIHTATAASAEPRQIVALLIDLDLFKEINDAHSHNAGDDLLKATADRIGQLAKLHGGHAARLSGDEFAAIMPLGATRLARIAEQFTAVIAEPIDVRADSGPVTVAITASLGIAVASSTDPLEGVALHHADLAMYHAKKQGGNRHVFHQPGMTMPGNRPRRGSRLRDRRRDQNGSGE
ncbi:GGDEF domain-containing protein [Paractinoplanes hotanensis]|uniref:GGDEF domain-containing protein n=1 Tax=Paractinoplanes hotanensis TaxID=2906497 RepID=A0ABT0XWZ4_9ACTN|nr:GGDEF domain-containing protein [Actinoplanes hotanensis]MCM4078284.1 GGDEF domain-containing protein [Actinoplanes hotanensis]